MVFDAGGPLIFNCRYTSSLIVVHHPESICRSIQDSELWIIPGGEHVPIYDSKIPFTSRALRFLDGLDSKSQ
jgi:pimeloyl-ACP methyl ester carboxylesterase